MIHRNVSSWIASDTATDAPVTASRAAPPQGLSHYVTSVSGSYSGTAAGSLTLKQGSAIIATWYVHDALVLSLSSPVLIAPGTAVSLELEAGGTGIDGAATLTGYTL